MTAVVHVSPELQPMVGGLADYTAILGRALAQYRIEQRYLVCSHAALPHQRDIQDRFPKALVFNTCNDLLRRLLEFEAEVVLLQYSGYGYAQRGTPFWLTNTLTNWKALRAHNRLVVMFHETWANGLPWQSSFWLSPAQRWCVARLVRLADAIVTSTSYYRSRIERFLPANGKIQVQPIFSNVGEPDFGASPREREPKCILFGRGITRRRTYERFKPYLDELKLLRFESLIEIGSEPECTNHLTWPFPIEILGQREVDEISAIMSRARYGLIECPVHIAGKSGVLAAFAAHGIVPIHTEGEGLIDGLNFGRDTVNISALGHQSNLAIACTPDGTAVRSWYNNHSVQRQLVDTWLPLLLGK